MKTRFALFAVFAACAPATDTTISAPASTTAEKDDAIADVDQTEVKRQSIGNCWIYATASWAESLHKTASGEDVNLSESYWTYWHWFDQIADEGADQISTGGYFRVASDIIRNYGFMLEGDFIASEATVEMSMRQHDALERINAALKTGALKTAAARSDRALVRQELDKAWALSTDVSAELDAAFGADVSTTLAWGASLPQGSLIGHPDAFATAKAKPTTVQGQPTITETTLSASLDEWKESSYPYWASASQKRSFLKKMQRAVHDRQPLIVTWFVDFNALDDHGRFAAPPTTPGRQGGHMVVIEDYQVTDVPGFGTLAAGTLVTDPAALDAALATDAKVELIRVKNSWGSFRPDRDFVDGFAGYHDLYMAYLDASIKQCKQKDGETDTTDCPYTRVPFTSLIFPAGY